MWSRNRIAYNLHSSPHVSMDMQLNTGVAAIKTYLNGSTRRLCRALVLQFLSQLWRIQTWARRQTRVQLYCTSLLLVYDAAKLRACCGHQLQSVVIFISKSLIVSCGVETEQKNSTSFLLWMS
jgi:hypothetical protein